MAQTFSGTRLRGAENLLQRSLREKASAFDSGSRTEVADPVGSAHGLFIVFDEHDCVPLVAQSAERIQENCGIARMQPDGRFVQNIADAAQVGAQLCGEADALRFAAGECRHGAVERKIAESDGLQEGESDAQVPKDSVGNGLFAGGGVKIGKPCGSLVDRHPGKIGDGEIVETESKGFGIEAAALANGANDIHIVGGVFPDGIGEGCRFQAWAVVRVLSFRIRVFAFSGAESSASGTTAASRVEREEACIGRFEGASAGRADARRRDDIFGGGTE